MADMLYDEDVARRATDYVQAQAPPVEQPQQEDAVANIQRLRREVAAEREKGLWGDPTGAFALPPEDFSATKVPQESLRSGILGAAQYVGEAVPYALRKGVGEFARGLHGGDVADVVNKDQGVLDSMINWSEKAEAPDPSKYDKNSSIVNATKGAMESAGGSLANIPYQLAGSFVGAKLGAAAGALTGPAAPAAVPIGAAAGLFGGGMLGAAVPMKRAEEMRYMEDMRDRLVKDAAARGQTLSNEELIARLSDPRLKDLASKSGWAEAGFESADEPFKMAAAGMGGKQLQKSLGKFLPGPLKLAVPLAGGLVTSVLGETATDMVQRPAYEEGAKILGLSTAPKPGEGYADKPFWDQAKESFGEVAPSTVLLELMTGGVFGAVGKVRSHLDTRSQKAATNEWMGTVKESIDTGDIKKIDDESFAKIYNHNLTVANEADKAGVFKPEHLDATMLLDQEAKRRQGIESPLPPYEGPSQPMGAVGDSHTEEVLKAAGLAQKEEWQKATAEADRIMGVIPPATSSDGGVSSVMDMVDAERAQAAPAGPTPDAFPSTMDGVNAAPDVAALNEQFPDVLNQTSQGGDIGSAMDAVDSERADPNSQFAVEAAYRKRLEQAKQAYISAQTEAGKQEAIKQFDEATQQLAQMKALPVGTQDFNLVPDSQRRDLPVISTAMPMGTDNTARVMPIAENVARAQTAMESAMQAAQEATTEADRIQAIDRYQQAAEALSQAKALPAGTQDFEMVPDVNRNDRVPVKLEDSPAMPSQLSPAAQAEVTQRQQQLQNLTNLLANERNQKAREQITATMQGVQSRLDTLTGVTDALDAETRKGEALADVGQKMQDATDLKARIDNLSTTISALGEQTKATENLRANRDAEQAKLDEINRQMEQNQQRQGEVEGQRAESQQPVAQETVQPWQQTPEEFGRPHQQQRIDELKQDLKDLQSGKKNFYEYKSKAEAKREITAQIVQLEKFESGDLKHHAGDDHYREVRLAIERGENVPSQVLDAYQDLKSDAERKSAPSASASGVAVPNGVNLKKDGTPFDEKSMRLVESRMARQGKQIEVVPLDAEKTQFGWREVKDELPAAPDANTLAGIKADILAAGKTEDGKLNFDKMADRHDELVAQGELDPEHVSEALTSLQEERKDDISYSRELADPSKSYKGGGYVGRTTETSDTLQQALERDSGGIRPPGSIKEVDLRGLGAQEVRRIGKIFGKEVVFFAQEPGAWGHDYHGITLGNKIYLNVASGKPSLFILGHEIVEGMKKTAHGVYEQFYEEIVPYIKNFPEYRARHEAETGGINDSNDVVSTELISDFVGEQMSTPEFWDHLAAARPSIFKRVATSVVNLIDRILKRIGLRVSNEHITDLEAARKVAVDAIARYADAAKNGELNQSDQSPSYKRSTPQATATQPVPADVDTAEKLTNYLKDSGGGIIYAGKSWWAGQNDATFFGKMLRTAEYWKDKTLHELFSIMQNRTERKHALMHDFLDLPNEGSIHGLLTELAKDKENYKLLEMGIDHADVNEVSQPEMEKWFADRGASPEMLETWRSIRTSLDKQWDARIKPLKDLLAKGINPDVKVQVEEEVDGETKMVTKTWKLKQLVNEMGRMNGFYAPRMREEGDFVVKGTRGDERFRAHASNRVSAYKQRQQMIREGWQMEDISKIERLTDSMQQSLDVGSMAKVIESVADKMNEKHGEVTSEFIGELLNSLADEIKGRGFRKSAIQRKGRNGDVTQGYIMDPADRFLRYTAGTAAGIAKMESSQAAIKTLFGTWKPAVKDANGNVIEPGEKIGGIDPKKEPQKYELGLGYVKEQMRNTESADRIVETAKSIATMKYLGFNPKAALVNVASMITNVPAALHAYAMGGKGSMTSVFPTLAKASKDYLAGVRSEGWSNIANADERAFMVEMRRLDLDDPQYTRDASHITKTASSKTWGTAMDWAMKMFGATERFNRGATMLAAYRLAREGGQSHAEATETAKHTSDRAHGVYGKATLPTWAQGTGAGARVGQAVYVYQKYLHNYLQLLHEMWGEKQYKAFAYATLAPTVLAGATGQLLPTVLIHTLGQAVLSAMGKGDDDPEKWVYDQIRAGMGGKAEEIARYGLFGAIGMNLSGSLNTIPSIPTDLAGLAGASGGILKDVGEAAGYVGTGELGKATEKLLPTGFAKPLQAIRESQSGVTTKAGHQVLDENGNAFKPGLGDSLLKGAGFLPAHESVLKARTWDSKREEKDFADARSKIYQRIRGMSDAPMTSADKQKLADEITRFNEAAARTGNPNVSAITQKSVQNQLVKMVEASNKDRRRLNNPEPDEAEAFTSDMVGQAGHPFNVMKARYTRDKAIMRDMEKAGNHVGAHRYKMEQMAAGNNLNRKENLIKTVDHIKAARRQVEENNRMDAAIKRKRLQVFDERINQAMDRAMTMVGQ